MSRNLRTAWYRRLWKDYGNMLYCLPVILGILIFTLIPMIYSLIYAFCDYNFYFADNQFSNFGFQQFKKIFGTDLQKTMHSFYITFRYAIATIAIGMIGSYIVALFLNQKTKGVDSFRVIYYLPCLIPAVAGSLLWKNITDTYGLFNNYLMSLGLEPYTFYTKGETVFPTILMLSVWGWPGSMIMWLAQMKNVPAEMYESAELDGAGYLTKTFKITIPMTTSMIFYQLIMSVINALQVFAGFYPLMNGQNESELDFIVVRIYKAAFVNYQISYAAALSWVLFVVIGLLTLGIFKTSKWVYYGEEA